MKIVSLALVIAWWAAALGLVGYPGFDGPDPAGFAFSEPIPAVVGLLFPSLGIAALSMSADPERDLLFVPTGDPERLPPVRMRPVHDDLSGRLSTADRRLTRRMAPLEGADEEERRS